jgi:2-aminoadipate transaminase
MNPLETIQTGPTAVDYARRLATMPRSCIREILSCKTPGKLISFGGGVPNDSCVPLNALQSAFETVLSRHGPRAFSYGPSEGEPMLREYVAHEWLARRGVAAHPDEILIVNGSQQALDLIGKAFIDPFSTVAVERPTYLAALQAFSAFEPRYVEVAMDGDGAVPEQLDMQLNKNGECRFYYTIPSFQNPSGACLPKDRRVRIADVLGMHGTMLVEDDPYSQLFYNSQPPPLPICSFGVRNALLMGTFSKMVAPGLRLGWVWTKSATMRNLITLKQAADLCTGRFMQLLALETLRLLDMDAHLERVRQINRSRRDAMQRFLLLRLARHCTWDLPLGGMFFWLKLKNAEISSKLVLDRCVSAGVAFANGASFFARGGGSDHMRLNFTQATDAEMDEGLALIGRVLDES